MKPGVLVISHGSREAQWVRLVDEAVAEVAEAIGQWPVGRDGSMGTMGADSAGRGEAADPVVSAGVKSSTGRDSAAGVTMTSVPVVSSFLEIVEGRLIQDGIDQLAAEGVTDVYVLPLFVSSGSTHVDDIAQAFGLPPVSAVREGELAPFRLGCRADSYGESDDRVRGRADSFVKSDVGSGSGAAAANRGDYGDVSLRVHFGQPIDDDPEIAELLLSNIRALSAAPERERLLLVAHGSVEAGFYGRWRNGMTQLARRLRDLGGFAGAEIAMLLPNQAACKLRVMLRKQPDSAVIVVPLFLSSGYFTRTVIPERLGELAYRYNGQSMLPHSCIARWMVRQIDGWLAGFVKQ